jgi:hypothetical protein
MNNMDYTYFQNRKGGNNVGIFLAGFSMFPIMGIIMMVTGNTLPGVLVLGFGLLIMGYMIFRSLALGWKYGIGEQGILLKASSSIRTIPFKELESVSVLEQDELDNFLHHYSHNILSSLRSINIKKWYQSSKTMSDVTRFVSVVVTETQSGRSGPMAVRNLKVEIPGPAVILKTVDNKYFLITPADAHSYVARVRAAGVDSAPIGRYFPSNLPKGDTQELASQKGTSSLLKKVMIINAIVIIAAAAGFFVWFVLSGQESISGKQNAPGYGEATEKGDLVEASISDAKGVWENESLFFLVVPLQTVIDLLQPGASVDEYVPFRDGEMVLSMNSLAVDGMVYSYKEEYGKEPKEFDRKTLADYLFANSEIKYSERLVLENREYEVFSVYADTLNEYVLQVFAGMI